MNPRRMLFVTLVLFVVCTRNASADPVSIEVGWLTAPPESVAWLNTEIDAFRKAYPSIEVTLKSIDTPARDRFATHKDVFGNNVEGVLGAHVTGIDGQFGYLAPYLAEQGLIKPLDDFDEPGDGFEFSDFYPSLLDPVRFEGKLWAVPWLAWDGVLVLDWELFQQAGITAPPRTWQEFIDYATQLTRDTNGDGTIDQWGVAYRTSDNALPYMFLSLVLQQEGKLMREGRFDVDADTIAESVVFMNNMAGRWGVSKEDPRSLERRMQDSSVRYAMHLETNHGLGAAVERPGLRVAPMPSISGRPRAFGAHRLYLAVRDSTREQEAASWEFVKWMTRADVSLPSVLAGFPTRRDFTSRADFRAMMQGKIQNPEVIFTSAEYGVLAMDRVVDIAPAVERFWQIMTPAFSNPAQVGVITQRAQDTANNYLGDWYPTR